MTTYYKATRPDGTSLGKLGEDSSHFGVVGGAKTPFAHIALRTRKNQVVDGVVSALRQRCQVIQVKCASVISEKLEDKAIAEVSAAMYEVEAIGKDAGILGAASPTPSATDLTQAEQLLADVVKAWSQSVAPAERDRRIAKAMRAADDYFVANHSVTQRGGSADHKPNTPQTPTPKVEDSVVEVGE